MSVGRKRYHFQTGVKRSRSTLKIALVLAVVAVTGFAALRPSSNTSPTAVASQVATTASQAVTTPAVIAPKTLSTPLPWPKSGLAAYSVPSDKLIAASAEDTQPVPVASLAKIITLVAVMKQKPLKPGEQGPLITITNKDIAIYEEYVRKSGTVSEIAVGQQISQYQAMQAVMYVSSNNMADTLATWAFGSMQNYHRYTNDMLKNFDISHTTVADDASGYSPNTVSTAQDMAEISYLYLEDPVLRQISESAKAVIPVTGTLSNSNLFINKGDVLGLKAGNTDQAGKCFIVASFRKNADQKEEVSVAVVLGSDSVSKAAREAADILQTGNKGHDQLPKKP